MAWYGRHGELGFGVVGTGSAGRGRAWRGRAGVDRQVKVSQGKAGLSGTQWQARCRGNAMGLPNLKTVERRKQWAKKKKANI